MSDEEVERLLVLERAGLDRIIEVHQLRLVAAKCRPHWKIFSIGIAGRGEIHPKGRHLVCDFAVGRCPWPVLEVQVIEDVD